MIFIDFYFWFLITTAIIMTILVLYSSTTRLTRTQLSFNDSAQEYILLEKTIMKDLSVGPVEVAVLENGFRIGEVYYQLQNNTLVRSNGSSNKVLINKIQSIEACLSLEGSSTFLNITIKCPIYKAKPAVFCAKYAV